MPIFKLPRRVTQIIETRINGLFDSIKGRFLGARGLDKSLLFVYNRDLSLPGMYEAATSEEGATPSHETLDTLVDTSKKYIDSLKLKTVNKVIKDVEAHLADQEVTPESIEATLKESWENVTSQMTRIVNTETQATKSIGLLEGIVQGNAKIGVEDPVVAFIPIKDKSLCNECLTLHLLPDGITPRLFLLSEVAKGYHIKGSDSPSIHGLHPHCRCQMVTVMPGFGFTDGGRVTYIKKDHSEIEKQRK